MPKDMHSSTKIDQVLQLLAQNKQRKIVVVAKYMQELHVVHYFIMKNSDQDLGKVFWLTGQW